MQNRDNADGHAIMSAATYMGSQRWRGRQLSAGTRPLIGELAVASGLTLPDAIATALDRQRQWGTSIGRIMISTGVARHIDMARLYATQQGIPFINLLTDPPDATLWKAAELDFYLREQCLPWRRYGAETVYVAADPAAAREAIAQHEGRPQPVFVTSPRDINRTITSEFGDTLGERAIFDLMHHMPENSAATPVTRSQAIALAALVGLAIVAFVGAPGSALISLNIAFGLCFSAIAVLRYASIFVGLMARPTDEEYAYERSGTPCDVDLPVYTVMVPLFDEASVLPIVTRALRNLDYPGIMYQTHQA